jgi:hypothetical protein
MARISCPHEDDVLMLATTGRWSDRAGAELRAHAATCPVCADLALVAQAIDDDRAESMEPSLPSSGTVWWRAQLRAKQDAVRESGRPITIAHAVLLAVAGGLAGAIFGATTDWFQRGLRSGREALGSFLSNIPLPSVPPDSSWLSVYGPTLVVGGLLVAAATAIVIWTFREE